MVNCSRVALCHNGCQVLTKLLGNRLDFPYDNSDLASWRLAVFVLQIKLNITWLLGYCRQGCQQEVGREVLQEERCCRGEHIY